MTTSEIVKRVLKMVLDDAEMLGKSCDVAYKAIKDRVDKGNVTSAAAGQTIEFYNGARVACKRLIEKIANFCEIWSDISDK